MASYKPRVIDLTIANRLRNKGAILVEGAKWCGKTTTCEQHASSILYMSDPDRVKQNLQLADISPRVDAAPAFVQESSAPFCKSIVHIVPSLVLTLLVSFITKRIVRAEGNVKAAKTDFQI